MSLVVFFVVVEIVVERIVVKRDEIALSVSSLFRCLFLYFLSRVIKTSLSNKNDNETRNVCHAQQKRKRSNERFARSLSARVY
jgi:hypothetical protein